ncbi:TP_methylase domain-containing protein [Cephalotus follicularis]|uniref:diphthine methyl ester synthase n=1 Tax=Cephalotus follicularis TaxID=3775 RepID=A0A1Q3B6P2_CEPFO|nr:TP_methylase domain-containing protein [Cephalotus follicularis]
MRAEVGLMLGPSLGINYSPRSPPNAKVKERSVIHDCVSQFLNETEREREMLYIIGLGLGDEQDITLRGLEAVKKCDKVYVEAYTSLLSFGLSTHALEKLYGKPITVADREMVEEKADAILSHSLSSDVAFLVVGDPFGATTHTDLVVRAKKLGVNVKVVHNASVMNAIGICGLQLYRYGETISIPFFTQSWRPYSFYDKILNNRSLALHTLCLLDIRVKEPSLESLCRGRKQYEPPRYMTINTAIEQLLEVEQMRGGKAYNEDTCCVGLARLGSDDQKIVAGTMRQLRVVDFGAPLHCLVIVGKENMLELVVRKLDATRGICARAPIHDTVLHLSFMSVPCLMMLKYLTSNLLLNAKELIHVI